MNAENLDDFLGVKAPSTLSRYTKWIAIAIGVACLSVLLSNCFGKAKPVEYATQTAARGRLSVSVSATGKLAPTVEVTVGSQLSGLVTKVVVDVNDRVVAGQPLALIDPEQLDDQIRQGKAALAANQAQVRQAQATVAESQAQLARLEEVYKLSNGRVPSKTELQTGRANYQRAEAATLVAEANVTQAQASLAQSQTQRARAVIRSPVNGVVLARQIDPGQTVAASFSTPTLFVIAQDLSKMKLEVAIDEADVGEVKVGQKANFTVDAFPGKTFPAVITRVDLGSNLTVSSASSSSSTTTSTTTGQVVSYAADLAVANPSLELRPGMTATADIVTSDRPDVLLVPNAALRFRPATAKGGGSIATSILPGPPGTAGKTPRLATVGRGAIQTIYVKAGDGSPEPVTIKTGDTDGTMTEVIGGDLKLGEQVITGQLAGGADNAAKSATSNKSATNSRSGGSGGG